LNLAETVHDTSPREQISNNTKQALELKESISQFATKIKYIYSLSEQIQGIEANSSPPFK